VAVATIFVGILDEIVFAMNGGVDAGFTVNGRLDVGFTGNEEQMLV
jgi:hypothetical protein